MSGIQVFGFELEPSKVLVTTAIGHTYFDDWEGYSLPSWERYASEHGLGIACVTSDLISLDDPDFKNGSWQKLLAPAAVIEKFPFIERICLLDTDIQIGPFAPDIFSHAPEGKYSVVSQLKNLPFNLEEVLRRMAFFRHHFFSEEYPLDSFLLGDVFEEFTDLSLTPPPDYFCAGVVVLDNKHARQMRDWFFEGGASQNFHGWEQTHLNYWIQREDHSWLPYEFQALWNYELAWKYPFLYAEGQSLVRSTTARECADASLWNNHFLHFAGSWYESSVWKSPPPHNRARTAPMHQDFHDFRQTSVSGSKHGQVFPAHLGLKKA